MSAGSAVPRIPLQLSRGCVVASIQIDLSPDVLVQFQQDLLEMLHTSGAPSVILDVAGVDLMDVEDFDSLRRSMSMAELMGARCLLSGLQPGVVAALVELGAEVDDVEATLDLDSAFARLDERGTEETVDPRQQLREDVETDTLVNYGEDEESGRDQD